MEIGDTVYLIESNMVIRTCTLTAQLGDFVQIRFSDTGGSIRVRRSRIYTDRAEAEAVLKKPARKNPWSDPR